MPANPSGERLPSVGALTGGLLTWACSVAVVLICGVLPTIVGALNLNSYSIPFRSRIFTTLTRQNLSLLVFPLAATCVYVLPFSALVRDRFIAMARMRANLTAILFSHFVMCAAITLAVFFVVGMMPTVPMWFADVHVDPGVLGPLTPAELKEAEARDAAMTTLTTWGPLALPLVYSLWLGLNAALYGCIGLALMLLQPNRLLALVAPWLGWTVVATLMAWAGLESLSPDLAMPFNLSYVWGWSFPLALGLPVAVLAGLLIAISRRREALLGCS